MTIIGHGDWLVQVSDLQQWLQSQRWLVYLWPVKWSDTERGTSMSRTRVAEQISQANKISPYPSCGIYSTKAGICIHLKYVNYLFKGIFLAVKTYSFSPLLTGGVSGHPQPGWNRCLLKNHVESTVTTHSYRHFTWLHFEGLAGDKLLFRLIQGIRDLSSTSGTKSLKQKLRDV